MKYIKTFENKTKTKYEIGDMVKLKLIPEYVRTIKNIKENLYVEITNIQPDYYDYSIYDFKTLLTEKVLCGYENMIRRKMTTEELKEYKIKKEAQKYNI